MHPIEDGIVVAVNDGADILINKPSVLVNVNVNVNGDESFESYSTESSSSTTNEEEEETNVEDDPSTIGPFSGFRRRRAERRASSIALRDERICAENVRREERMRADDARNKAREKVRRQADEKRQMANEAIPETMLEANFDSLRAARISVTVVKDESNSYGLGLVQVPRKKNMVKIDALVNEGLLSESPLRVGDILKTVNNKVVTEHRPVMLQLMNLDGPVTITVETPTPHGNPAVVQAFCRKSTIETLVGISFSVTEHCTTHNELCGDLSETQEVTTTKLLKINTIESNGLLANSALSPGDLVLAINGVPCKSPDEATALILESSFTVNILALNPKLAQEHCGPTRTQRWMRGAKRAGIAVGGGTMLGIGVCVVLIPFPPPFGEVLVVGGVSVLGTEFEGPKRVFRNARNSLENAIGRHGDEELAIEQQLKQNESVAIDIDCYDSANDVEEKVILRDSFFTNAAGGIDDKTSAGAADINDCWTDANIQANIDNMYISKEPRDLSPSPSPTKSFLKSIGRNVVLPFLDQVVGDRKKLENLENFEPKRSDEEDSKILEARKIESKTNAEEEEIIKDDSEDQCSDDNGFTNNAIAAVNSNKTLDIAAEVNEAEYNMSEKSSDSEVLEDDEKIDVLSSFN